jgi:hypothetical protein
MKEKIVSAILIIALIMPVASIGQEKLTEHKPDIEIGKPSSLGQLFGFKFKGQLRWIPVVGKGITAGQRTVSLHAYFPADGAAAYVVSGSPSRMAEMLRTEYPDGIDAKSAKNILMFFVLGCSGEQDASLVTRMFLDDILGERIPNIPKEKLDKLLEVLFDPPVIKIQDNDWSMQVMIIGENQTIRMSSYKGTLKPFMITEFRTRALFDPLMPFGKASWDIFTEENLKLATENKKKFLEECKH